ncbi:MAG: hypothetical protein Q8N36_03710 [bacterium]|nr:hypothetical protein [bacterium]
MSKQSQSDIFPANVVFFHEAADDFRKLDQSRKTVVLKAIRKISTSPLMYGKPLGTQGVRALAGFRSVYVDNASIRIIWIVGQQGTVQIVVVAGIAQREGMHVYDLVSSRKEDVYGLVYQLLRSSLGKPPC